MCVPGAPSLCRGRTEAYFGMSFPSGLPSSMKVSSMMTAKTSVKTVMQPLKDSSRFYVNGHTG